MKKPSKSAGSHPVARVALCIIPLFFGFTVHPGMCDDRPPVEAIRIDPGGSERKTEGEFNLGAWFATSLWPHISEVDGQRCPSEPTCSSYSAQAFRKHGFFIGWVMTVDRLIHEADEGRHSRLVKRNGEYKIFDPVEKNDFWWYGGDENSRD